MGNFPLNTADQFTTPLEACCSANSGAPSVVTAGAGLDALEVTGQTIDRKASSGTALAHSIDLATAWLAALTDTKSLSFTINLQESADDSTWDTAEAVQAVTVEQLATATTNYRGTNRQRIDLMDRKRYIRFNVTPTLSNTATDTASFHTIAHLGGWNQTPQ